jgi:DNA repair protein RadD
VSLALRDYQLAAKDALRDGVRAGHQSQILCAPTGSGKTVIATSLMQDVLAKATRSVFMVDRIALVDQTSRTFDQYGIPHGVMQADHWRRRPWERIQVASAQTVARRGILDQVNLLVVDEAHTIYKSVKALIGREGLTTIGLTATPFTKGLGDIFTNLVNVTTTDALIEQGWLAPLKVYAARAVDMRGARLKFDGEWAEDEVESRALTITGDVVTEWMKQSLAHFGGPAKTLVFSATVRHGEELCRQFQAQGFDFRQVSYKDGNDEHRRALIDEFRKPDSQIVGLVSCEALAKGFDVPDVKIGVSARPYRRSLSGHIQQIGRLMRPADGKGFALLLDHSGNYLRFREDMEEFFASGATTLSSGLDATVRKEPDEKDREAFACHQCRYVMPARAPHCPACGWERPKKQVEIMERPGELVEVGGWKKPERLAWMQDKQRVWAELCGLALERKAGDVSAASRFAKAQFKTMYGEWPRVELTATAPETPSSALRAKVQRQLLAYFKGRAAA